MLPLGLLNAAQGHPVLVELKDGDTFNGHLFSCDTWMNLVLREVVHTDAEGAHFFRLPEAYIRGNNIKFIRIAEELVGQVKEQQQREQAQRSRGGQQRGDHHGGRGDRGGRGGGRGGRGRGRGRGGS